jgi:hypothetical protein
MDSLSMSLAQAQQHSQLAVVMLLLLLLSPVQAPAAVHKQRLCKPAVLKQTSGHHSRLLLAVQKWHQHLAQQQSRILYQQNRSRNSSSSSHAGAAP